MEDIMNEEAFLAASAAAARFIGIVRAGGTMRAIVEEWIHVSAIISTSIAIKFTLVPK